MSAAVGVGIVFLRFHVEGCIIIPSGVPENNIVCCTVVFKKMEYFVVVVILCMNYSTKNTQVVVAFVTTDPL